MPVLARRETSTSWAFTKSTNFPTLPDTKRLQMGGCWDQSDGYVMKFGSRNSVV